MAATDARPVPRKNTAWRYYFDIRKNDGTLITTWAGQDTEVSIDGGNFADTTAEATEIQTSGCGYIDLSSDEMNGDCIVIKTTVTNTDALPVVTTVFPEEVGDYRLATTQKVDVETIKTQAVTCGAGVTVLASVGTAATSTAQTGDSYARLGAPAGASVSADLVVIDNFVDGIESTLAAGVTLAASQHVIVDSGTVTTLTNLPAITANWLTAAGIAAGALDGKGNWNIGKTGYSLTATTGLGNQTADITGNLSGSVGSVTGAVGSVTGAVGSVAAGVTVTTNNDKTGYSLVATTGLGNQTSNITGDLSGSVGSVTGAVGSVTGAVGSVTAAVTLANGAHGGAAASITLADYSDFQGGASSAPTVEEIRAEMDSNSTQLAAIVEDTGTTLPAAIALVGGSAGAGASSVTITWTSEGSPVPDGDVWITSDSAGANVVAGTLQTNSMGQATFMLDAGSTYYLFAQRDGRNSIRGERFVAVAD